MKILFWEFHEHCFHGTEEVYRDQRMIHGPYAGKSYTIRTFFIKTICCHCGKTRVRDSEFDESRTERIFD
jgi:hypothetical protein